MGFIYKITNNLNNKCYIGKTEKTVEERWKGHTHKINQLIHLPLYRALKKYGVANFTVDTIEECDDYLLDEHEHYWIKHYDSCGVNGYNCTLGGEGGLKDYSPWTAQIIERYTNGERLDLICKELHLDYASIRPHLVQAGLNIDTGAGPKKLSKKVQALDPNTGGVVLEFNSISEAGRYLSRDDNRNPKAIANHIGKQKNTNNICHGYKWQTI